MKTAPSGNSNVMPAEVADIARLSPVRHPWLTSRPRLGTARGVRRELSSLYAACKAGAVTPADAARMTFILKTVLEAIVAVGWEERLIGLERAAGVDDAIDGAGYTPD